MQARNVGRLLQSCRNQLGRFLILPGRESRQEFLSPSVLWGRFIEKVRSQRLSNILFPAGILILILARNSIVNHNGACLTLLGFLYTCLFCLWVSTRIRLLVLGSLIFFVYYTPSYFPLTLTPIDPFPVLKQDEVRTYTFHLVGLQEKIREFGHMEAELRICGKNLKDIEFRHSNVIPRNTRIDNWNARDLLVMSFSLDNEESLTVSLRPKPGTSPTIQQGQETHRNVRYPDSVFLVLQNEKCRIVYHAIAAVSKLPTQS